VASKRNGVGGNTDELLCDWSGRTTAKRRITGCRMHEQLLHEGLQVGITTVREYLAELWRPNREVFIPGWRRSPGRSGTGRLLRDHGGCRWPTADAWKFLMRLPSSGKDFAWIYERCDQIAFLDGHVRRFAYFGGASARGVYDNYFTRRFHGYFE